MTRADRIKFWLGLPALVVAALGALYVAGRWVTRVHEAPERLEAHEALSAVVHESTKAAAAELHQHTEVQQRLIEAIVRGECLENRTQQLALQGLLTVCRDLGIRR